MNTKPLFIVATHGNERIGLDALALLQNRKDEYDWIVGNPKAFIQNTRMKESNLNRAGLGDPNGNTYEARRAAEIQTIAEQYTCVIDIHGTNSDTGTFLIIPNPSEANLRLASMLDIDTVVVWPSITPEMQSPLSEFFPCGLEIEVGDQTNAEQLLALRDTVKNFLDTYQTGFQEDWKERLAQKRIYRMYGNITAEDNIPEDMLQEQVPCSWNRETFTPIFVNTYNKRTQVLGYKLEKISITDILLKNSLKRRSPGTEVPRRSDESL